MTITSMTQRSNGATQLTACATTGERTLILEASPDPGGARRLSRSVRRVERVTFELDGDRARCVVSGRSSRLPFRTRVPLTIGLGLMTLGVPARATGGVF